jgi:hypothetical protein
LPGLESREVDRSDQARTLPGGLGDCRREMAGGFQVRSGRASSALADSQAIAGDVWLPGAALWLLADHSRARRISLRSATIRIPFNVSRLRSTGYANGNRAAELGEYQIIARHDLSREEAWLRLGALV